MVTLLGETFPARVGASLLIAAGLADCVTANRNEYFDLCLALAKEPSRLRALRERLGENRESAPLFDMKTFTRNLEDLYFRMWDERASAGNASHSARGTS